MSSASTMLSVSNPSWAATGSMLSSIRNDSSSLGS
jgi:hypothetical protein